MSNLLFVLLIVSVIIAGILYPVLLNLISGMILVGVGFLLFRTVKLQEIKAT